MSNLILRYPLFLYLRNNKKHRSSRILNYINRSYEILRTKKSNDLILCNFFDTNIFKNKFNKPHLKRDQVFSLSGLKRLRRFFYLRTKGLVARALKSFAKFPAFRESSFFDESLFLYYSSFKHLPKGGCSFFGSMFEGSKKKEFRVLKLEYRKSLNFMIFYNYFSILNKNPRYLFNFMPSSSFLLSKSSLLRKQLNFRKFKFFSIFKSFFRKFNYIFSLNRDSILMNELRNILVLNTARIKVLKQAQTYCLKMYSFFLSVDTFHFFIKCIMRKGKKIKAYSIFFKIIDFLRKEDLCVSYGYSPYVLMLRVFKRLGTSVSLQLKFKRKKKILVPFKLNPFKIRRDAIRRFVKYGRLRSSENSLSLKLSKEFLDVLVGKGNSLKNKFDFLNQILESKQYIRSRRIKIKCYKTFWKVKKRVRAQIARTNRRFQLRFRKRMFEKKVYGKKVYDKRISKKNIY